MRYRFATSRDLPQLVPLLRLYLKEMQSQGDPILLTNRSVEGFRSLAYSYLAGGLFGVVVLAEEGGTPVGFALCGEQPGLHAFDSTLGKTAHLWAIWVHPSQRKGRVALDMLSFGRPHLVEMGFQTCTMSVRADNQEGTALTLAFGAALAENLYTFPLAEEPAHLKG